MLLRPVFFGPIYITYFARFCYTAILFMGSPNMLEIVIIYFIYFWEYRVVDSMETYLVSNSMQLSYRRILISWWWYALSLIYNSFMVIFWNKMLDMPKLSYYTNPSLISSEFWLFTISNFSLLIQVLFYCSISGNFWEISSESDP